MIGSTNKSTTRNLSGLMNPETKEMMSKLNYTDKLLEFMTNQQFGHILKLRETLTSGLSSLLDI